MKFFTTKFISFFFTIRIDDIIGEDSFRRKKRKKENEKSF